MIIIRHRRNTISELIDTPANLGIEVDIRSHGERLIIHHDPYVRGELFEDWIKHYRHGTLILNVKEEGLEERLLTIMNRQSINDFFFLDQSFPFLMKIARLGEHRCAVRVSEFESIETALALSGKVDWVWIDYFSKFPLSRKMCLQLKNAGFKLCLVSPELQGYDALDIRSLQKLMVIEDINVDAVCTKLPELWQ
jgi:hypothetical protein